MMRVDAEEPLLYHHATQLVAFTPRIPASRLIRPGGSSAAHGLRRAVLGVVLGAVIGFVIALQIRRVLPPPRCQQHDDTRRDHDDVDIDLTKNNSSALLFVGVMTAQKYLDTRARAVYETWGKELPGKMAFFSSANSVTSARIPLVRLAGVDDSYPPQKKSFLMLKYIYDHFGDQFEWFMRADDDVYVRPDKLEALLRSVDSDKPQFIGQAGRGSQEEFGLLSLEYDENFCMGGPGVLMSRATLALVAPHVSYCLRNLYTTHEDVELGRCVQKFAGIPCTWSYEMQTILYHNSSGAEAFTATLKHKEVHRAITLHPVKQFQHLYRLHNYMKGLKIQELQHKCLLLRRDAHRVMGNYSQLLGKYRARHESDVHEWDFFTAHALYSATNANPRRRIEAPLREALDDVVREVMEMTNAFSRQRGRVLDFKEVLYGYHRFNPITGQDLVLDMQLVYRKYRGRKMTIPVRRHSYLQRTFLPAQSKETSSQDSGGLIRRSGDPSKNKSITFLVPLAGRLNTFKRFAALYEEVCLGGGDAVSLVLVLFPSPEVSEIVGVVRAMQERHPHASLAVLPVFVPFARGLALQLGAAHVQAHTNDTILLFIDVDVVFTAGALQRVRLNTVLGTQVYFPIVFSEFDPSVVGTHDHFSISDDTGYWRNYGFGIASAYPSDLVSVGGFDTGIRGWGKEDVDLYDKFVRSNLSVFRAADPGLVHVFHIVECDDKLDAPQLVMCHGTRGNTYAGNSKLATILDKDPRILNKAHTIKS